MAEIKSETKSYGHEVRQSSVRRGFAIEHVNLNRNLEAKYCDLRHVRQHTN